MSSTVTAINTAGKTVMINIKYISSIEIDAVRNATLFINGNCYFFREEEGIKVIDAYNNFHEVA